jgi:hypothetical protein
LSSDISQIEPVPSQTVAQKQTKTTKGMSDLIPSQSVPSLSAMFANDGKQSSPVVFKSKQMPESTHAKPPMAAAQQAKPSQTIISKPLQSTQPFENQRSLSVKDFSIGI